MRKWIIFLVLAFVTLPSFILFAEEFDPTMLDRLLAGEFDLLKQDIERKLDELGQQKQQLTVEKRQAELEGNFEKVSRIGQKIDNIEAEIDDWRIIRNRVRQGGAEAWRRKDIKDALYKIYRNLSENDFSRIFAEVPEEKKKIESEYQNINDQLGKNRQVDSRLERRQEELEKIRRERALTDSESKELNDIIKERSKLRETRHSLKGERVIKEVERTRLKTFNEIGEKIARDKYHKGLRELVSEGEVKVIKELAEKAAKEVGEEVVGKAGKKIIVKVIGGAVVIIPVADGFAAYVSADPDLPPELKAIRGIFGAVFIPELGDIVIDAIRVARYPDLRLWREISSLYQQLESSAQSLFDIQSCREKLDQGEECEITLYNPFTGQVETFTADPNNPQDREWLELHESFLKETRIPDLAEKIQEKENQLAEMNLRERAKKVSIDFDALSRRHQGNQQAMAEELTRYERNKINIETRNQPGNQSSPAQSLSPPRLPSLSEILKLILGLVAN